MAISHGDRDSYEEAATMWADPGRRVVAEW